MTKKNGRRCGRVWGIVVPVVLIVAATIVTLAFFYGSLVPAYRPLAEADEGDIKVACVGDSITYGCLVFGWPNKTYPSVLGKKLGDKYTVNNYGYSGATAQTVSDNPYVEKKVYKESKEFLPDIVIIMLGTNDTRTVNQKGLELYREAYSALLDTYIGLSSSPKVYVMAPPPCYPFLGKVGYHIDAEMIKNEIRPTVFSLAEEKGIGLIDLYSVFDGKKELFTDGVHPNAKGAELLAQTVYDRIKADEAQAA